MVNAGAWAGEIFLCDLRKELFKLVNVFVSALTYFSVCFRMGKSSGVGWRDIMFDNYRSW